MCSVNAVLCHYGNTDYYMSILIRAHWLQVVAQLLDAGADITLQNETGETALEVAVDSCRDMILGK